MVAWAIDEIKDGSLETITFLEILPDVPTSTPSSSLQPISLSSISSSSLSTTSATTSDRNSLSSRISTPTSVSPTSSKSLLSSTLPPSTSSEVPLLQNTKPFSTSSSSLNSGAIAGIVIACVIIFLIGAFFAIRIWSKKKRALKLRNTWSRSFVGIHYGIDTLEPSYETKFVPRNGHFRGQALSVQIPSPHVSVPPISYNNDAVFQFPKSPVTSSSPVYSPGLMSLSPYSTTVVCTFMPSLPDELTICVGETLRVLAGYEDGWSLCMDCRGEQGMVPNECLEKSLSSMGLLPPSDDFKVSKNRVRVTSLAQAVGPSSQFHC